MTRTLVVVAVTVIALGLAPRTTAGQTWDPPAKDVAQASPLLTTNHILQASLERIAERSSLWREALESVRATSGYVLVLTPDQVVVADALNDKRTDAFDPTVLAEAAPVPDEKSRVRVVLVVVNLALIEEMHRLERWPPRELDADLDRVLVHEIYGHAFPYLLAGNLSGRCADPKPKERASDACAIRRENAVRAELGLGRRTDYGLQGLALARRWR